MTHKPTILRLQKMFGGTVTPSKARDAQKHKLAFGWYVGDLKTVEVLRKVRAYMTTKRLQADLILEYRRHCCPKNRSPQRGALCGAKLVQRRQMYFAKLRRLNRKGP